MHIAAITANPNLPLNFLPREECIYPSKKLALPIWGGLEDKSESPFARSSISLRLGLAVFVEDAFFGRLSSSCRGGYLAILADVRFILLLYLWPCLWKKPLRRKGRAPRVIVVRKTFASVC
jgi:hypothetical protein